MSKLKVNRPQPPIPTKKVEVEEALIPTPEVTSQLEEEKEEEGYPINLQYDELENRVTFYLYDGTRIELKSPKAKQFLQIQSWYQSAPAEYQSDVFSSMKLAHTCMTAFTPINSVSTVPSFDEFLDSLEIEDIERVGSALACFRSIRKLQR